MGLGPAGSAAADQGGPRRLAGIARSFEAGRAHHRAGRLDRAAALYRKVLEKDADHADALHLLGVVAYQTGRAAAALALIERALPALAELPDAHLNYGNALLQAGRRAQAMTSYRRAVALKPDYGMAHNNLARALIEAGDFAAALDSARCAVALIPDFAGAQIHCAAALFALDRHPEAEAPLRRALALAPAVAALHRDLGNALQKQRRFEEAVASYRRALAVQPDDAEAHYDLGRALRAMERLDAALDSYRRAVRLKPDFAAAHNNLGNLLKDLGRPEEAVACFRRAIALEPDFPAAHHNLGNALDFQGKLGDAVAALEQAAALDPAFAGIDWFHARKRICDWDGYCEHEAQARARVGTQAFRLLTLSSTPTEQLACARRAAAAAMAAVRDAMPGADRLPHRQPEPRRRIRLGYISADFNSHAVAHLIAGLIEHHDRRGFEVFGYATSPGDGSPIRARLAAAFDRLVDLSTISDGDAARLIHADGVDILIDLNGFTRGARTAILARRPAPIQVNYLGYPGTMGADFIDYIIVDRFVAPSEQQEFFSEHLVDLPDCYQCSDDQRAIAEPAPSRAECGLPDQGFVFCCFNNAYKITPDFFDIWMRLLHAVPGSVLWLLATHPLARANLMREAAACGVAPQRLVFAPRLPLAEHLARHAAADLFLDTLPYNAHSTASDALWAGLPLLTCVGDTFAGRVAGSLLRAVGLGELAAASREQYEAMALRLAGDAGELARLRARLGQNRHTHPLFDTARCSRHLEAAYREMRRRWSEGRPPASFSVPPAPKIGLGAMVMTEDPR